MQSLHPYCQHYKSTRQQLDRSLCSLYYTLHLLHFFSTQYLEKDMNNIEKSRDIGAAVLKKTEVNIGTFKNME